MMTHTQPHPFSECGCGIFGELAGRRCAARCAARFGRRKSLGAGGHKKNGDYHKVIAI